jgi:hypothetical protein
MVSALVTAGWFFMICSERGAGRALQTMGFMILPTLCIWFPDLMSEARARRSFGVYRLEERIDASSSPRALRWGGWFLLMVPWIIRAM